MFTANRSTSHHAVLAIGSPIFFVEFLYTGQPLVQHNRLVELIVNIQPGGVLDSDSWFGWALWADPDGDLRKKWNHRQIKFADLILGEEVVRELDSTEQVLSITMPGGEAIPVRVRSRNMLRSRPRGKREYFTIHERTYGTAAWAYHLSNRSTIARGISGALGEDHGDAIQKIGRVPWEPQPWHCPYCHGSGMNADWSQPHATCQGGVVLPDHFFTEACAYVVYSPSEANRLIATALGAARELGHTQSMALLYKCRTSLFLSMGMLESARVSALEALLEWHRMLGQFEHPVPVDGEQSEEDLLAAMRSMGAELYNDVLATQLDRAGQAFEARAFVEKSPIGAAWITHAFVRKPAAAASATPEMAP